MEENDYSWIWVLIAVVTGVYFLFFNKTENISSTYIPPTSSSIDESSINQRQQELENKLDQQQNTIDQQQQALEEQQRKSEEQNEKLNKEIRKQQEYNDCIRLWSNSDNYIKPNDEAFCRSLYL